MPSFGVALPVGAIAFYLYDCVMLLHENEVMFVKRSSRWTASAGSRQIFLGKRIAAPAMFAPWSLLVRSFWSERVVVHGSDNAFAADRLAAALLPIRCLCTLMLLVIVVALPAVAVFGGNGVGMLGVFGTMYLLVISAVGVLIGRRRALGLDAKALVLISLDALACAPFAVNLVVKVLLRVVPPLDTLSFSSSHCRMEQRQHLQRLLETRVDELLATGAAGAFDAGGLRDFKARLSVMNR
jgi:hypothetical protein